MFRKKFKTTRLKSVSDVRPPTARTRSFSFKKWLLILALGCPIIGVICFIIAVTYYSIGLPDVRDLDQYRVSQSTFIYDRNGVELYAIHGDENRESIEVFDRENPAYEKNKCHKEADLCTTADGYFNVVLATIAIEDDNFYNHHGFDAERLLKAVASQFLPNVRARGGSTITQQYIKNTLLTPERTISRKFRELILAVKLENVFNKEEVLELYLNRIPYGSNAYGVELAAKTYFNKEAKDLTLAEAAILAALPNAPTRYSPYGNYRHAKLQKTFTENEIEKISSEGDLELDEFTRGLLGTVINLETGSTIVEEGATDDMSEGAESEEETTEATEVEEAGESQKPERLTPDNTELGGKFVYVQGRADLVLKRMYALDYITEEEMNSAIQETWTKEFTRARENILAPHFVLHVKQLLEDTYGKEVVEQGGLKVYTTLDYELQKRAEAAITDRHEFNTENFGATNAALVSLDRETGEVMAMVGSADYFDEEIDGNVNMAMSYVQPGSSYKPFVFALAFARGFLQPATILYDVRTEIGGHSHVVENYDGEFWGPMTVRRALAQSRNVTAIKSYYLAGEQENLVPFTQNLGLNYLDPDTEHGSSLALGSAEVQFLSLVQAYASLANYGIAVEPKMILKVENNEGEPLEEADSEILDPTSEISFGEVIDRTDETFADGTEDGSEASDSPIENLEEITPTPIGESIEITQDNVQALDPQAAYLVTEVLSDTEHRLGPNLTVVGWQNAAKTGTANKRILNNPLIDEDDQIIPSSTLTVGYTTELVTGVWAGNSDGSALRWNANGYDTAAPIWKNYMTDAHAYLSEDVGVGASRFKSPYGITKVTISGASGLLPNEESTPNDQVTEDVFASYAIPQMVEDKFRKIQVDKKTQTLWVEGCPITNRIEKDIQIHKTTFEVYGDWQKGIDEWAEEEDMLLPEDKCTEFYTREHEVDPEIDALMPFDHGLVPLKPFKMYVYAGSPNGISRVEFYLDGMLQYKATKAPYTGAIRPSVLAKSGKKGVITIRAYDQYDFSTEIDVNIKYDDELNSIKQPSDFEEIQEMRNNRILDEYGTLGDDIEPVSAPVSSDDPETEE